jgi:hypothetical protein
MYRQMPDPPDHADWEPLRPADIADLLAGFDAPWWIAGGWALDLFLGAETRRHDDIDVAVLRRDQLALYDWLRGWDLHYATPDHTLQPWDGRLLRPPIHGIWARRSHDATAPWTCDFLLDEDRDGRWVYRRDSAITRSLDDLGGLRNGAPYLCPEVVLLYKSKNPTPKDDADFDLVLPRLSSSGRLWLCQTLRTCDAGHRWVQRLAQLPIASA